jgi:GGDEF domain-containing protein
MNKILQEMIAPKLPMRVIVTGLDAADVAAVGAMFDPKTFAVTCQASGQPLRKVTQEEADAVVLVISDGINPAAAALVPSRLWVPLLCVLQQPDDNTKKWAMGQRVSDLMMAPFTGFEVSTRLRRLIICHPEQVKARFSREAMTALLAEFVKNKVETIEPVLDISSPIGHSYPAVTDVLGQKDGVPVMLEILADLGFLKREVANRLRRCPVCFDYRINYREVCPKCSSVDIVKTPMFHHFACCHVGPVEQFRRKDELVCPKCSKKLQLIGLDYEKPMDYYHCETCDFSFSEPSVDAQCLRCSHAGKPEDTKELTIYRYQLTPLAGAAAQSGSTVSGSSVAEIVRDRLYFFSRREVEDILADEDKHASASNDPFSILLVRLDEIPAGLRTEDLEFYMKDIGRVLGRGLRTSDILGIWDFGEFLVVMPGTPAAGAQVTLRRMERNLQFYAQAEGKAVPRVRFSMQVWSANAGGWESLTKRAEQELES